MKDRALCNIMTVSCAFFFSYMGYVCVWNALKYTVEQIKKDDPTYYGDGYISLCIIFGTLAVFTWLAPLIIAIFGSRYWLMIGTTLNIIYIAQFLYPLSWVLYFTSLLVGIVSAFNVTSQGCYLTLNSTPATIGRNMGILWGMIQMGNFGGNLFLFFMVQENSFDVKQRNIFFLTMTIICCISALIMYCIKDPVYTIDPKIGLIESIHIALKLFTQRDMLLLIVTYIYCGKIFAFYAGIYSSSIAFTEKFTLNQTRAVSLSGMLIGLGETTGALLFGPILGKHIKNRRRYRIVILGFLTHVVTFVTILLNLPSNAPIGPTTDSGFVSTNIVLALLCSFTLGFGDACYITQIYGVIGTLFVQENAAAFAIFKFVQNTVASTTFFYARLGLFFVISTLLITGLLGTITFFLVDRRPTFAQKRSSIRQSSIVSTNETSNT